MDFKMSVAIALPHPAAANNLENAKSCEQHRDGNAKDDDTQGHVFLPTIIPAATSLRIRVVVETMQGHLAVHIQERSIVEELEVLSPFFLSLIHRLSHPSPLPILLLVGAHSYLRGQRDVNQGHILINVRNFQVLDMPL
jgi:hypothetical protein